MMIEGGCRWGFDKIWEEGPSPSVEDPNTEQSAIQNKRYAILKNFK